MKNISPQNCLRCGKESGTCIVCLDCLSGLTKSQRQSMDKVFQRTVIELYGNECCEEGCGHMAASDSGELAADHLQTKGAEPLLRYDLANAVCRCMEHHNKRHTAEIKKVPSKDRMPKETIEKQDKYKKGAVCKIAGCPIFATFKDGKCFKHTKHV